MKDKIKFYSPAGNTTALVVGVFGGDESFSVDDKIRINDEILQKYKEVEQVGFLGDKTLEMAGGEICFNALRCAGKYFLDTLGLDKVEVGLNGILYECGICKHTDKMSQKTAYYTKIKPSYTLKKLEDGLWLCDLKDIVHIIYDKPIQKSQDELKAHAKGLLKKFELLDRKASGVMYLDDESVKPVVWVRDIKTLFYESACGSGSFASFVYKKDVFGIKSLKLKQPSSNHLFLDYDGEYVKISSFVDELNMER